MDLRKDVRLPPSEYLKRLRIAKAALQNLVDADPSYIMPPPIWFTEPDDVHERSPEDIQLDLMKELHCYRIAAHDELQEACKLLSEIDEGMSKASWPAGRPTDWALKSAAIAICTMGISLRMSLRNPTRVPEKLLFSIQRAAWRDAGLPIRVDAKGGGDEDAWITKQLKSQNFDQPK
jgi:hypothetical protein